MWRPLLALLVIQLVASTCPSGFSTVAGGQCRGVGQLGLTGIAYDHVGKTAVSVCMNTSSTYPIIIHNKEQQDYWTSVSASAPAVTNHWMPLGIVCNTSRSRYWTWADGSPLDYFPPVYDTRLEKDCVMTYDFYMWNGDGRWSSGHGDSLATIDVYCTRDQTVPARLPESCFDATEDGKTLCFAISNSLGTWEDARALCASYGASVASIHNEQENAFLRRTAVSRGLVNGLLLGGVRAATPGGSTPFEWVDGSRWDYQNFVPDFPMEGKGDCLAMDTFNVKGDWVNTQCSTKMPTACVRKGTTGCSGAIALEGELVTSPGYPHDASLQCDMFLRVDPGRQVEVTVELEANTCCDHLVLYEGSIDGTIIANLTGSLNGVTYRTSASNLMRASWQPRGGVNVKGAMLTFRAV